MGANGRFAAATRADQGGNLTALDFEIDVANGEIVSEKFADVAKVNESVHENRQLQHEKKEPEQLLFIGPNFFKTQTNCTRHRDHFWRRIFVGEFRGDVFAGSKAESSVCNGTVCFLRLIEMHLNAAGLLIVNGAMPPCSEDQNPNRVRDWRAPASSN